MRSESEKFIEKIALTDLFANVGKAIPDPSVYQINNWFDAIKSSQSQAWEDFGVDRHNEMVSCFPLLDGKDARTWVDQIESAALSIERILQSKISSLELTDSQKAGLRNIAIGDLLEAWKAIEYSKHSPPKWHLELAEWYLVGHFPCGWSGHWPEDGERNGQLIVF